MPAREERQRPPESNNLWRNNQDHAAPVAVRSTMSCRSSPALLLRFGLRLDQLVVERVQSFRKSFRSGNYRHEIRVALPARHDVNVQVIGHASAGGFTEI